MYGAIVALMQTDLKRLVAYSSVSHLGFVVLGTFAFTEQAMAGGVLQMVNHGLSTGALFLLVGMVYERTHTRDLTRMGSAMSVTPWLGGTFLFVALSSAGLPGLNGFVGEFLVILGTLARNVWFGAIAATGVVLAAITCWSYQRMAHGPVRAAASPRPRSARGRGPRPRAGRDPHGLRRVSSSCSTGSSPRPLRSWRTSRRHVQARRRRFRWRRRRADDARG